MYVYKAEADNDLIREYKRKVIEKTNSDRNFYCMKITDIGTLNNVMNGKEIFMVSPENGYYIGDSIYIVKKNTATTSFERSKLQEFLNMYIEGKDNNFKMFSVRNTATDYQHFVLFDSFKSTGFFDYVLALPPQLAVLDLLSKQEFSEFNNREELLEYIPSDLYTLRCVGKYDSSMLVLNLMEEVNRNIEVSTKVLKKIK